MQTATSTRYKQPFWDRIAPKVTFLGSDELTQHLRATGFEIEQISYFGANRMNPFIVARRTAS